MAKITFEHLSGEPNGGRVYNLHWTNNAQKRKEYRRTSGIETVLLDSDPIDGDHRIVVLRRGAPPIYGDSLTRGAVKFLTFIDVRIEEI